MAESSPKEVLRLMDEGWRLFLTPHLRSPQGYIVQVHKSTFKKLIKDGLIIESDNKPSHEYVKSNDTK